MPVGIFLILLVSSSLGCWTTIRVGQPQFDALRAPSPAFRSIDIGVDVVTRVGRKQQIIDDPLGKTNTYHSFRESGYFSQVFQATHENEWQAKLEISKKAETQWISTILCLATGFILPGRDINEISIETTITRPDGTTLPPIIRKDSFSLWFSWFLIPFPQKDITGKEIVSDLTRASLAEAVEKGYFEDASSPASSPVALDENGKPIFPE